MRSVSEADWKVLRRVKPAALERLCQRILAESVEVASSSSGSAHERYLKLFELIRQRDKELAHAFNDMRRSTAIYTIISICRMGLLTDEEFAQFSEGTRAVVRGALGDDE
ncbi:MAG: peptide ABC transporter substrate-binding protein [Thiohalomonadaceae bacterium]